MSDIERLSNLVEIVPVGIWLIITVTSLFLAIVVWRASRREIRRVASQNVIHASEGRSGAATRSPRRDGLLTTISLVPATLFWAMVLAGSFHGLVAFGREELDWSGGWEYLVPGTLDGVSVTFALLAFRAIQRGKAPDRCNRVVWGAAMASATVNFAYEYTHSGDNVIAGGYLALLSLFAMVMFHEFLDQFEDDEAPTVRRATPKFGTRWITWPTNTLCAAVAWRNYPPEEDTPATVREAIANLDRVRELKRQARRAARTARREERAVEVDRKPDSDPVATSPIEEDPQVQASERPTGCRARRPDAYRSYPSSDPPVRVPARPGSVTRWAETWVAMCSDDKLIDGPLNDDPMARARFGLSARQLRNIRHAATSGALRRRAHELGLPLHADYEDRPRPGGLNGRRVLLGSRD